MKISTLWGILLLTIAIPIYGIKECKSCHKHHERRNERDYEYGVGQLRQNRSGYTFIDQIHPDDHDDIDQINRGNIEPFGPQEYEDYGDSEYEKYYDPDESYSQYDITVNAFNEPTYVDYFPTYLRTYPYYIGHRSGPFFGNGYGGF